MAERNSAGARLSGVPSISRKPLSRRAVLRGGGFTLALPMLEAMAPRRARATPAPKRFITFFHENGMYPPSWEPPSGGETDFALSPVLKQFEPFRSQLLVLKGLDLMGSSGSDNHMAGSAGLLTGRPNFVAPAKSGKGMGPSLDQYIAGKLGSATRFPSLQLAGLDSGYHITFAGADQPIPPEVNPFKLFTRIFGDGAAAGTGTNMDALLRLQHKRKSIFDFVNGRIKRMQARLGAEDAKRLEWHATSVREIETQLAKLGQAGAGCTVPDLGPKFDIGQPPQYGVYPNFVKHAKLQLDMMFTVLVCDLSRVMTYELGAINSCFFWLGHSTTAKDQHHGLSHEPDSNQDATKKLTDIAVWYAQQIAYLAGKMNAVNEGSGTMLDNSLVLWGNQLARGNSHSLTDAAFILLGRAGGAFKTGRYLRYDGKVPHNNLLVSIANGMGLPETTFGQADWCTGPLKNLQG